MKKVLIVIIMLIMLVGCSTTKVNKTDAILFKEEYESLNNEKTEYGDFYYRELNIDEENPFIYKEASDIIEMIENKETFAVYFGFSSCPWCRSVISSLVEVSNNLSISTIYYVDVKEIRDILKIDVAGKIVIEKEGTNDYNKLLEKISNVLDDYILTDKEGNDVNTGKKRIYAPNIVAVVDGVATNMTTGISDAQTDAYMDITDKIKTESIDKIKCTIECVVKEKAVCMTDKKC